MENKRGSEIFLGVVGVTTLLVAIIGATFAYFSATAKSGNEAISVQATTISLGYEDIIEGLNVNMIPSEKKYATYAAFNESYLAENEQCIDDNGNEICSVYEFYIGNPSETTKMDVVASINVVTNEFTNLKYEILDELGNSVVEGTFGATGSSTGIEELNQTLLGFKDVKGEGFNAEKPSTYAPIVDVEADGMTSDKIKNLTNVRHYKMLIWLNEAQEGNIGESGKVFTAGISFTTGGASGGVTGIIAAANQAG